MQLIHITNFYHGILGAEYKKYITLIVNLQGRSKEYHYIMIKREESFAVHFNYLKCIEIDINHQVSQ